MKSKILKVLSVFTLCFSFMITSTNVFAAEESNSAGGWSEEEGYFNNGGLATRAFHNKPESHTGKAEYKDIAGTGNKRSTGTTKWKGKYHYTRATLEWYNAFGSNTVTQDSGRRWGNDKTSATSPWQRMDKISGFPTAYTYYGY